MPSKRAWSEIWEEYDEWYYSQCAKHKCRSCGKMEEVVPERVEQKVELERIVAKHTKRGKK